MCSNIERECIAFVKGILENRPRDGTGKICKYNKEDKDKIISILEAQKSRIDDAREILSADCYELVEQIYSGLIEIVEKNVI